MCPIPCNQEKSGDRGSSGERAIGEAVLLLGGGVASLVGHMIYTSLQSSEQLTQPPGYFAEHLLI